VKRFDFVGFLILAIPALVNTALIFAAFAWLLSSLAVGNFTNYGAVQ
jgi:hypothetical protein